MKQWAVLAAVFGLLAVPPLATAGPPAPPGLAARAASEGSVRVIVGVAAPFVPEGLLAGPAASSQRRGIEVAQRQLLVGLSGTPHQVGRLFRSIPYLSLEVGPDGLEALTRSSWVVSIEEDAFHRFALDGTVPLVEADVMIAAGFDGSGKTVVVIDSGVDSAHPNFAGKLVDEACFASGGPGPNGDCPNGQDVDFGSGSGTYCTYSDECFHGTHVAGIAVGNGPAYSGVAQGATLISIQVATRVDSEAICGVGESPCPRPAESDMVLAVEEVFDDFRHEHTIASVNMSIGGAVFTSQSACDTNNGAMKAAIDNLVSVGIPTVIASGNDYALGGISEPACISSAVSVAASTDDDRRAAFSNVASFLSLWAPGVSIHAPRYQTPGYMSKAGTSMAAPHVAGAWAILAQAVPGISVATALSALQTTGVPISHTAASKNRIDVRAAYESLTIDCQDGLDNDGDGRVDWAGGDPGCDDASDADETSPMLPCDNGSDDDGDGFTDTADPACSSGAPFVPDPNAPAEQTQCQDGVNNDGQAGTDFDAGESIHGVGNGDPNGLDPECSGKPWSDRERAARCGLGFELCLLLAGLAWWRRATRSGGYSPG